MGQGLQALAAPRLKLPAEQVVQLSTMEPDKAPYLPGEHGWQALAKSALDQDPAGQTVHPEFSACENLPAVQCDTTAVAPEETATSARM